MSVPRTILSIETGEAVRLGLQLVDAAGDYEVLTGRAFAWVLTDERGATVLSADGSIITHDDKPTAVMAFDADDTADVLDDGDQARTLYGRVLEVTAGGPRRHCDVDLNVGRGVPAVDLPAAGSGGTPMTLITLQSE